jgi:ATP synthase protein I
MVRAAFKGCGAFSVQVVGRLRVSTSMSDTPDDKAAGDRNSVNPLSEEAALSARLSGLDKRLSKLQGDRKAAAQQSGREHETAAGNASGMAIGFRLSSELVAGVLVGGVLGWTCDHVLPTKPWGLIVFVLVGFVAGVINVMRAAGVIAKQSDRLK